MYCAESNVLNAICQGYEDRPETVFWVIQCHFFSIHHRQIIFSNL